MDGFCREIGRARNIQDLEGIRHVLLLVIKPSLPYELIAYSRSCTIRTYQEIIGHWVVTVEGDRLGPKIHLLTTCIEMYLHMQSAVSVAIDSVSVHFK